LPSRHEKISAAQEWVIDEYLRSKGIIVAVNPAESTGGGDRFVDGEPTEYKTLTLVSAPDDDKLSKVIASVAMNARSQAPHVVIDARSQPAMTNAVAIRGIQRAFGADRAVAQLLGVGPKIGSVRVIFNGGGGTATDIMLSRPN